MPTQKCHGLLCLLVQQGHEAQGDRKTRHTVLSWKTIVTLGSFDVLEMTWSDRLVVGTLSGYRAVTGRR